MFLSLFIIFFYLSLCFYILFIEEVFIYTHMRYLKTFESITNYQVDVLTGEEFSNLYRKIYPKGINLKDKIHYFSWNGVDSYGSSKHSESIRLITAHNKKDILGICFLAYWSGGDHYSVSYLSTNNDYFHIGVSKKLLEELFKYFSKTYPDEVLHWSGYSIDGWKYLRKTILEMADKYNVELYEKPIEYLTKWDNEKKTFVHDKSPESDELYYQSKEEIKKKYNIPDFYY